MPLILTLIVSAFCAGCHVEQQLQPPAPSSPHPRAVSGPRVYVGDVNAGVVAIDTTNNSVTQQLPVEGGAGWVVESPDRLYIYATARSAKYVKIFQANGLPVPRRLTCGKNPVSLAITHDGKRGYVIGKGDNTLTVIDLEHFKTLRTIKTGLQPIVLALSSDDRRIYVLTHDDTTLSLYDAAGGKLIKSVKVGVDPFGMALDAGGKYVYVSSYDANDVTVYDAKSLATVASVKVADGPNKIVAAHDGNVYVGCVEDGSVAAFKRDDWKSEARVVHVGTRPRGMALSPDEKSLYIALEGDGTVAVLAVPTLRPTATLNLELKAQEIFSGR